MSLLSFFFIIREFGSCISRSRWEFLKARVTSLTTTIYSSVQRIPGVFFFPTSDPSPLSTSFFGSPLLDTILRNRLGSVCLRTDKKFYFYLFILLLSSTWAKNQPTRFFQNTTGVFGGFFFWLLFTRGGRCGGMDSDGFLFKKGTVEKPVRL